MLDERAQANGSEPSKSDAHEGELLQVGDLARETGKTVRAIHLYEELGLSCPLHFLFKFQYHAQFDARGAEHELCSVYIARCSGEVRANRNEILGWRWVAPEALEAEMSGSGAELFTPWFKLEWARIWQDHRAAVLAL